MRETTNLETMNLGLGKDSYFLAWKVRLSLGKQLGGQGEAGLLYEPGCDVRYSLGVNLSLLCLVSSRLSLPPTPSQGGEVLVSRN